MTPAEPRYCLDTGPLLDFLLLRFDAFVTNGRETPIARHEPSQQFRDKVKVLKTPELRQAFERFLAKRKPFVTVPGVLVEIHRHARTLPGLDLKRFWARAQDELGMLGIIERSVPLTQMDASMLSEFGPVDESLVVVSKTRLALVTLDTKLYGQCRTRDVRCLTVEEIAKEVRGWGR